MSIIIFLVGVALAVVVGIWWERVWIHHELRKTCLHEWGDTHTFSGYAYRHCRICKKQQNRNPDGKWID